MTSLAIDYPPEIFAGAEQFKLPEGDSYDGRCGEVFITLERLLVFHCAICDEKYGHFPYFLAHLTGHYNDVSQVHKAQQYDDVEKEEEQLVKSNDEVTTNLQDIHYQELHELELNAIELFEVYNNEEVTNLKFGSGNEELFVEFIETEDLEKQRTQDTTEYCEDIESSVMAVADHHSEDELASPISKRTKTSTTDNTHWFPCNKCEQYFSSAYKMRKHVAAEHALERKYKCHLCGFAFKEEFNLRAHVKRHTGQKQFGCEVCEKKFFTRTEVTTHMRTHTGEKPFVCSYCGIAFRTSGTLSEHIKRHKNVRPHKCRYCDKSFFDSAQLKDHMPVHSNERPFMCAICMACFARRKSLIVHNKLHANAKEYGCDLCEKSFNQRPALLAHVKTNHRVMDDHSRMHSINEDEDS